MISDLSETLRALLTLGGAGQDPKLAARYPELANSHVVLDRPSEQFNPAQTTIDLYLYDVRENMELRSNEPVIERNNGQAIIHRPPLRVACSYLVTAWPVGGSELALQEHRLLSQALMVLSRHPTITPPFLKGQLAGQEPPLPMMTAKADGLKEPAEFWTALGNKLRPSLSVVVTISMQPFEAETAELVTLPPEILIGERTTVSPGELNISAATAPGPFRIVGRVTDANGVAVAGAVVSIASLGLSTTTDEKGRYSLGMIPANHAGSYTLHAQSPSGSNELILTLPARAGTTFNVKLP
ncbi:MAG: Pvc16 family protein [Pyrinomonadaceae bacterium]